MGVSKNNGTPKWMVKIVENPIKMDDLGPNTPIFGNIQIAFVEYRMCLGDRVIHPKGCTRTEDSNFEAFPK